ncbi:hypothetical protein CN616_27530 [Bacillus toyonensis]|uniref:hypothetical protein n=1 Tax=Bacillus toyonensis TaxID=155322 RepID=UPI000BEFEE14|nr:hypothetical protein [Bacillus toyonensis]PEM11791.1 hypothetical protein CN616_27530 [Bacillus toyonensis]PGB23132.1 hypothetical protein COM06_26130 [Bacillus toyonensis]
MCQFCSNQKNNKRPKFRLFNINPIPFHTSTKLTNTPSKSQKNPTVVTKPANTPSKSQKNSTPSLKSANTSPKVQKVSTVLLKLPNPHTSQPKSQKFKIKPNSSQSISKHQINTSRDNTKITNEIQKLLHDYQLIHLPIIIFLEQIHIKGFIMNFNKDSVTIIGPNVQIKDNSTNKIIQSPNKINIKIKSIQAISDIGNFLQQHNTNQMN